VNVFTAIWHWLGDSKEQIVSISALIGVYIAFSGLRTWRKELKGKAEYQKAKDVLKAVYRVKDAFMVVRSPWMDSRSCPQGTGRSAAGRRIGPCHQTLAGQTK
jgi:hypothetical protein